MGDAKFWKEYIESYDRVLNSLTPYHKLVEIHKKALLDRKRVLESCAGSGILSLALLEQGIEVHALDQNKYGLDILKRRSRKNPKLKTYVCDANNLPFDNNYFDGISSMLAIQFMQDPIKYLREHTRVLAPKGILVISGVSENAKDFEYVSKKWIEELKQKRLFPKLKKDWDIMFAKTTENIEHYVHNWFSIEELSNILENEIGLKVIDSQKNPLYYERGYFIVAEK